MGACRSKTALVMASALLGAGGAFAVTSLGRDYTFGFDRGNLIRNWSFEDRGNNWHEEPTVSPRVSAKADNVTAITGTFVGKFSRPANASGTAIQALRSDPFPIEPGQQYTLSMYVGSNSGTAGVKPSLSFYSSRTASADSKLATAPSGSVYPGATGWFLYSWTFTSPSQDCFATLILADAAAGQSGNFWFDDVVLEKSGAAGSRNLIRESVDFVNDIGQVHQKQMKIAGGGNVPASRTYLVESKRYDFRRRQERAFASYLISGNPDMDMSYELNSTNYNTGSNGRGALDAYPYEKTEYWNEPGDPVKAVYARGTAWKDRMIRSGFYFVSSLVAPDFPEVAPTTATEGSYRLDWSQDVEERFFLSWTDLEGNRIQDARESAIDWEYTKYEYFPDGNLKKVLQPTDVSTDESQQEFRSITNYNAAGEVTSTYSKDRGLRKFWYNRIGNIRFSRHESQQANQYDYTDYDVGDRPVSMGTQTIATLSTDVQESRTYTGSDKIEHVGVIYDSLDVFQARTGLSLQDIMPGRVLSVNGRGRTVCDYNRNPETYLSGMQAKEKLVATFYNYNKYGEVAAVFKYVGPARDPANRIHAITYEYDYRHRLSKATLTDNKIPATVVSVQKYEYDSQDRITKILGINDRFLMSYAYYDWGGIKSVKVGGTGTLSTGIRIDFAYQSQEWLKEIKATRLNNGDVVFQQFLGYEGKAIVDSHIPALLQSKFDGSIAQQVLKYANDVLSLGPVRLTNYQYDPFNRLSIADGRKNANANPLNAFQQLILSDLTWSDTEDMDTRLTYDAAGRIQTNQNGVASADKATYTYQANSYKLDRVSGKLSSQEPRDASAAGTFVYDPRGRLVEDKSKRLTFRYGWDDMPVDISVTDGGILISDVEFYDASGLRAAKLRATTVNLVPILLDGITFFVSRNLTGHDPSSTVVSTTGEVSFGTDGSRRWVESYNSDASVASSSGSAAIFGASAQMGEITNAGVYRFFLQNHQGSVIRTVGDNGDYNDGASSALDYLAQGRHRKLKTGTEEISKTYTGKEYEAPFGLYALGARWLDPDLGSFLTPDPAEEFPDPYSFVGGNAINFVDPDGMSSEPSGGGPSGFGGGEPYIYMSGGRLMGYGSRLDDASSYSSNRYLDGVSIRGGGASSSTPSASSGNGTIAGAGGMGSYGGMGGDRSPGGSGGPSPMYGMSGPSFGSGSGPDFGSAGSYDSYGGGYVGSVNYLRDLGFAWMQRGGATYVPGLGFTSYGKNPALWMSGYALNQVAGLAPTNGKEVAFASLYLVGGLKLARTAKGVKTPGGKLDRFQGPKPKYHENLAHVRGRGLRPGKTPLPSDAASVYKSAVPNDPVTPTAWFGRNSNGQTYRFSLGNDGTSHFSGIHGVGSGTRNITEYAIDRLNGK